MEEELSQQPIPPLGELKAAVKAQIVQTVQDLVALWQKQAPIDQRRVVRPTGEGSFSIDIEPYRGSRTWWEFRKQTVDRASVAALEKIVRQAEPRLLGCVVLPGRGFLIQDGFSLASSWCNTVCDWVDQGATIDAAITRLCSDLGQLLVTGNAIQKVLIPLSGVKLPSVTKEVVFDANVILRRLQEKELSDLASHDVTMLPAYDVTTRSVTTALEVRDDVNITFRPNLDEGIAGSDLDQKVQLRVDSVLACLHLLKEGRAGVVAMHHRIEPGVLPNMHGFSRLPLIFNPYGQMKLTEDDVDEARRIYDSYQRCSRSEVKIAASRLVDAENRHSAVDGLLDAVIGLEVLLNPRDDRELSFRVAMNYAYLDDAASRRDRYELMKKIQETRNRIVHGGANLNSKEGASIPDRAKAAKHCLRDALRRFLLDDSLPPNAKLDSNFWLERMIPPPRSDKEGQ